LTFVSATEARQQLDALIDQVETSHQPVQIAGSHGSAVLVSQDDWNAIQETLHLLQVPGMRESIQEGMATKLSDLSDQLDW
jgi:prevent-host-death family protein